MDEDSQFDFRQLNEIASTIEEPAHDNSSKAFSRSKLSQQLTEEEYIEELRTASQSLVDSVPGAIAVLRDLMYTGEKEDNIKLKAAKSILEEAREVVKDKQSNQVNLNFPPEALQQLALGMASLFTMQNVQQPINSKIYPIGESTNSGH